MGLCQKLLTLGFCFNYAPVLFPYSHTQWWWGFGNLHEWGLTNSGLNNYATTVFFNFFLSFLITFFFYLLTNTILQNNNY